MPLLKILVKAVRVRYRIDGILETKTTLLRYSTISLALVKLNSRMLLMNIKNQDGGFSVVYENQQVDLRISVMPSYYGEKIVIRILILLKV